MFCHSYFIHLFYSPFLQFIHLSYNLFTFLTIYSPFYSLFTSSLYILLTLLNFKVYYTIFYECIYIIFYIKTIRFNKFAKKLRICFNIKF